MNKQNKIIVSIVGITIILLTLLGITYAYYLTRIEGNTNTNSISISTAKLELLYSDGNGELEFLNIMPGDDITAKTFTVTNNGNSAIDDYAVSIEEVVNTLTRTQDLTYDLSCVQKNASNVITGECLGKSGEYPNKNTMIVTNSIEVGYVHEYTLKITYANLNDVDQSDDMGSTIKGKVQIYGLTDTIDLTGTISNYSDGDYVQINSETKKSQIINDTYTLVGIKPGSHTLRVYDKTGVEKSSKVLTITKGQTAGIDVDNNIITMTDDTRTVSLDINVSNQSYSMSTTVSNYSPFGSDASSLAYNIYYNSKTKKNGTELRYTPLTQPAKEISKTAYKTDEIKYYGNSIESYSVSTTYQNYYWTYGTSYTIDKDTGYISLDKKTCKYSESGCISDLVAAGEEVYVYTYYVPNISKETNTPISWSSMDNIYLVTQAPAANESSSVTVKFKLFNPVVDENETEKTLGTEIDDYGRSYYYRGGVLDNYVDFGGKCWRIVRIEGDGSIKLVLEDKSSTCSTSTGNWVIAEGHYGHADDYVTNSSNQVTTSVKTYADYVNSPAETTTSMKYLLDNWLSNSSIDKSKLKDDNWCLGNLTDGYDYSGNLITSDTYTRFDAFYEGDVDLYYDPYIRIYGRGVDKSATFKCSMNNYIVHQSKIGALTADEVMFAGGTTDRNMGYYLVNDKFIGSSEYWYFWTLTPSYLRDSSVEAAFAVNSTGGLRYKGYNNASHLDDNEYIRPAITLVPGIKITSGDGTKTNPYVIDVN